MLFAARVDFLRTMYTYVVIDYYAKTITQDGQVVAEYAYDAWGVCKIVSSVDGIAELNPIRYRGYYWDNEIQMYYLKSRYYDAEIGRFINMDEINILEESERYINGLNLYVYCLNNPINFYDPDGRFIISLIVGAVVGAVVAGTVSVVAQGITQGWGNINWGQFGIDFFMGALTGLLAASGIGLCAAIAINAGLNFVSSVGSNGLIQGSNFNDWRTWLDIGISTGIGAFVGWIGGAGAMNQSIMSANRGLMNAQRNLMQTQIRTSSVLSRVRIGVIIQGRGGAISSTMRALNRANSQWSRQLLNHFNRQLTIGIGRGSVAHTLLSWTNAVLYRHIWGR